MPSHLVGILVLCTVISGLSSAKIAAAAKAELLALPYVINEDGEAPMYVVKLKNAATKVVEDTPVVAAVGMATHPTEGHIYALAGSSATSVSRSLLVRDGISELWDQVGPTGLANLSEGDLAFDPLTATLYAVRTAAPGFDDLFTVDVATGEASAVGDIVGNRDLSAMEFTIDGNLWVLDSHNDEVLRINKATGDILASASLSTGLGSLAGMARDPESGTLLVADGGSGGGALYQLDPQTGNLVLIGAMDVSGGISALTFSAVDVTGPAPVSGPALPPGGVVVFGLLVLAAAYVSRRRARLIVIVAAIAAVGGGGDEAYTCEPFDRDDGGGCIRSIVMTKGASTSKEGTMVVNIPVTVVTKTGQDPTSTEVCTLGSSVTEGTIYIEVYENECSNDATIGCNPYTDDRGKGDCDFGTCDPGTSTCTGRPSLGCGMDAECQGECDPQAIFVGEGQVPLNAVGPGTQVQEHVVPVAIENPVTLPAGRYWAIGAVEATFTDDSASNGPVTLDNTGDVVMCFTEEVAPGVDRLALEFLDDTGIVQCDAGTQKRIRFRLTNNDPTESVELTVTGTSRQNAKFPQGPPGATGVASLADPGMRTDDFVLAFSDDLPANGVLPHPPHPTTYDQRPVSKSGIVLAAGGGSTTLELVSNSYVMCQDGSCSEVNVIAEGEFSGGDDVVVCASGSLFVVKGQPCEGADAPAACCLPGGSCTDDTPEDCIVAGGTPAGAYTACQGDVSPANGVDDQCEPGAGPPAQACCYADASCDDTMEPLDCMQSGGTPQGPSTTCPANCPIVEACTFPAGGCADMIAGMCASAGGTVQSGRNCADLPDHFLCYKTKGKRAISVHLADAFDSGAFTGKNIKQFCTPANKNGEGTNDLATHLTSYRIKGPHTPRTVVRVDNQFGGHFFDTKKADSLFVPSAKSIPPAAPPGLPAPLYAEHYRCLRAKTSKGRDKFPKGITVTVDDQFGNREITLKSPSKICLATDKNEEGVTFTDRHLMCYRVSADPKHSVDVVQANNQLGAEVFELKNEAELCVPSSVTLMPPAP